MLVTLQFRTLCQLCPCYKATTCSAVHNRKLHDIKPWCHTCQPRHIKMVLRLGCLLQTIELIFGLLCSSGATATPQPACTFAVSSSLNS